MNKSDLDLLEERVLLGDCLIGAQKVEFTLYGIVSCLTHLDEAKNDARLRKQLATLTPDKFLRGPIDELKATLGMLEKVFGERLLLSGDELSKFIDDRNLIVHNYWRLSNLNIEGAEKIDDPVAFLKDFSSRCNYWKKVLRGLLGVLQKSLMENQGKSYKPNEKEIDLQESYYAHAHRKLIRKLAQENDFPQNTIDYLFEVLEKHNNKK